MICLNATDTIRGFAAAGSQVTCTIMGMELASGVEDYKILDQRQLASSMATIYTVPALTQSFVLSIHIVNNDVVERAFTIAINGTANANLIIKALPIPAGGWAMYTEQGGWVLSTGTQAFMQGVQGTLIKVTHLIGLSGQYFAPTTATRYMYVEGIGGGGGGGGVLDAASNSGAGGGGGAGGYSAVFTSVLTPVVASAGGGGPGGAAGANPGIAGGDTTFGSLLTAKGGSGGLQDTVSTIGVGGLGGRGGLASSGVGDLKFDGGNGGRGLRLAAAQAMSGAGGNGYFGGGAQGRKTQGDGGAAAIYGSGGAGGCDLSSAASQAGGNGSSGLIRIWEFA